MPSNLIQGQGNKGYSCIHVQSMDTCQHVSNAVTEEQCGFIPLRD